MGSKPSFVLLILAVTSLASLVSGRAVNISNTWMLPEEGFPVFYRHFRDRISWYEADAVCQFHHANLVTADNSAQYDAIRAYLKELDVADNVWIGLSRTTEKPGFAWADFRPLSSEGHWQQAIPLVNEPLCVAMDPAADFLWKPLSCGGPEVASFVCELPVPSWALGPTGCLLTELPSLTVLYIPEQLALELTSDCGLDGTKRIACKGNVDREEMLRQLKCSLTLEDYEEATTKRPATSNPLSGQASEKPSEDNFISSKTTKPWIWTSNTIDADYGIPTRQRRETEETQTPPAARTTVEMSTGDDYLMMKRKTSTVNYGRESEATLEPSLAAAKSEQLNVGKLGELTTENVNSATETAVADTKTAEFPSEDVEEYPSAINQGQLFSIIENGTMFDIIELNETVPEEARKIPMQLNSNEAGPALKTSTAAPPAPSPSPTDPPAQAEYPKALSKASSSFTSKLEKKPSKKDKFKDSDSKKLRYKNKKSENVIAEDAAMISKEVEMFPIIADSSIKLNRTHRKELPLNEAEDVDASIAGAKAKINFPINNELDEHQQHIEIKLQEAGDAARQPQTFFVTTKKARATPHQIIDPKINVLNRNATQNNESEPIAVEDADSGPVIKEESLLPAEGFDEETDQVDSADASPPPDKPLEPEPEIQPRPNRKRQLTRPQRRSYYPYFFSRVLG